MKTVSCNQSPKTFDVDDNAAEAYAHADMSTMASDEVSTVRRGSICNQVGKP